MRVNDHAGGRPCGWTRMRVNDHAVGRECGRIRIRENTENPRILDVNNIIVVLPSKSKRILRQDNVRKRVDENAGGRECG